ncbi:response regulator [Nitrospira sp. KM1]|uniref:response regulator n=1 Tax=Nitrospira sp. KM1 TaxID=1936990 RepID=UPI0015645354|nr:response regulator [Nitrospira sp. KM1]
MIIDDDRFICEALKDRFDSLGYEGMAFTDGCSALATIALETARSPVDLVLLDLHMPGMDGMWVLGELQVRHAEIPVIMMSGHPERKAFEDAVRAGARDYVRKPIDFGLLEQKIKTIFGIAP